VKWGVSIAYLSIFFVGSYRDTVSSLPLFTTEIHLQYGTAAGVPILTCSACSVSVDVVPPFDIQVLYPRARSLGIVRIP
jgi:hypothetical protein